VKIRLRRAWAQNDHDRALAEPVGYADLATLAVAVIGKLPHPRWRASTDGGGHHRLD